MASSLASEQNLGGWFASLGQRLDQVRRCTACGGLSTSRAISSGLACQCLVFRAPSTIVFRAPMPSCHPLRGQVMGFAARRAAPELGPMETGLRSVVQPGVPRSVLARRGEDVLPLALSFYGGPAACCLSGRYR